mgnify:CR=1 FL=1
MKTVNQIRDEFLKYFENKGHEIIPSSPLVPQNDPSLLFVNSGMVQFKNVFTGAEQRPYKRATTSQKCVRAGGKHNDLENVGYTARHHTFFEMLGNFSFGDYFKDDAIAFSWELVTKYFGLPQDKLLVTVYSEDDYAASVWKKVAGLSDDRIIRIPTSDNFWMMGDTGPCGPCSEIFYDHGPGIPGGPPGSKDEDGDRFIEIWNLVFMQYEQFADGSRENLPNPCIDTGMGLERIAAILQGKHDNYDIDLLRSIIEHVADLTSTNPDGDQSASHRVIADHLRASAFLIADGVLPGNEGRGYVLRRIMRRGMRHANILGAQDPLLYKLVPTLNAKMAEAYPELRRAETLITETLSLEEQKFKKTLEHGLHLLEEETANLRKGDQLAGDVAFKLYDTFGFPLDLTQDALRAKGIDVDLEGFEKCMERQRQEARKAWSGSGDAATEKLWFDILDKHEPTEFLGYDAEKAEGRILEIIKDGSRIQKLGEGDEAVILTNQTPFYAESGGQAGDTGIIKTEKGAAFVVKDTQKKLGKLWAHIGKVSNGTINSGENAYLEVDHIRRARIKANHSATHLMHEALRRVLGDHVAQKGSFQNNERTRFDISHNKAVTEEQIREIESIVNREIRANTKVTTHIMSYNDALETGAQALFGEKYGDEVRVVAMGTKPEGENKRFSVELCGGTHVNRTGEIGLFKLVAQSAVSSGVRRVEALTGENAFAYLERQEETVQEVAGLLKSSSADILERLETLVAENRKLSQEVKDLRKKLATAGAGAANGPEITEVSGIKFTGQILVDIPAKDLKSMADDLKAQLGSGVVALITKNEGKASLVVAVTDDLTPRMSAVDLVKAGAEKLGGKGGGGRPDMAQAGGPDADAANDAFLAIQEKLSG